nr:uncharacterized protein LOC105342354 [Crassostrea gigas]
MKYLGIYILVILVSVEFVSTQCTDGTCDCHCTCCRFCTYPRDSYCEFCQAGWGGTINNRCQRKKLTYKATATSSSTSGINFARNAVDEDPTTYALTKSEKNPLLTITLSNIFTIRWIYLILQEDSYTTFFVFIKNSTLTDATLCNFFYATRIKNTRNIICTETLTGDQIVITTNSTFGRLVVFETQVYECSQGTYGENCDIQCRNCVDNTCEQYTGVCEMGCKVGWYGDTCNRPCPSQCVSLCDRSLGCTNCQTGYNGPNCNPCDRNTYGKNCSLTCQNCDDCNNVYGCGECWNGFHGDLCDLNCPKQCRNDICYRQTGVCLGGCKDGYVGTKCDTPCKENCATCSTNDLCISCLNGRFGTNCEYLCPGTCGGSKTCDKNSGVCSECNPGTFDQNCTQQCSRNCLTGTSSVCDRNGACIRGCVDGWFGPQCDKQCPIENCKKCNLSSSGDFSCEICNIGYYLDNEQEIRKCVKCPSMCVSCISDLRCTQCIPNFTGNQCENECNINCVDGLCELDGTCTYGCNNSKFGVGCTVNCRENCVHCYTGNNCTKCLQGHYGLYCIGKCYGNCFSCTSYYNCEICKPGFYGDICYNRCDPQCLTCDSGDSCTSCRDGWSGLLCQCSKNCKDEDCDGDGICQSRCNGSYYGERCDVSCPSKNCQRCEQMSGNCTECSKGLYGINCSDQCSESCLGRACDMTGACLRGCKDGFDGKECTKISANTREDSQKTYFILIGIGTFILIIILVIFVFCFKRKFAEKQKQLSRNVEKDLKLTELLKDENHVYANNENAPDITSNLGIQKRSLYRDDSPYNLRGSQAYLIELDPNEVDEVELPNRQESEYYNVKVTRIPVDQLWETIQNKRSKGELEMEYESIPNGLLEPCKEAIKKQNRPRNRYKKMYPYDANRVILKVEEGTNNSEYINASYVQGFAKKNEYIAAQGPFTQETVYDFWRMIWQQNCAKIIMLTNVEENGVMKCNKYWPDTEDMYGIYHVKMEKEETSANYTVRTFHISLSGKAKTVTHFHFTAWPDKGVPRNVTSIVDFRNKVVNYEDDLKGPLLIHCSAGVGRTGTFMALDFLIKQGEREGFVDVISCVASMRHQRVHVVQTVEQYVFLHDALVEGLTEGNSNVTAAEFPEYYKRLNHLNPATQKSGILEQFQLINKLSTTVDVKQFETAKLKENRSKNRYSNILPAESYRIFITSGDSNYINAIQAPGYKSRNAYAITQMPLANTVQDFWCLVLEQDVSTIVMMNSFKKDKTVGIYWPVNTKEASFGAVAITLLAAETRNSSFDVLEFKVVNNKSKEERIVKQFQCKFWSEDAVVPESPDPMLEMIEEVNAWQRQVQNPTIVVHCMNGAKKSGLYCTIATIIERLRAEQEVSVLQTVVQMRSRRPQFVASKEQLMFCYDAVCAYLNMFNTYSNVN